MTCYHFYKISEKCPTVVVEKLSRDVFEFWFSLLMTEFLLIVSLLHVLQADCIQESQQTTLNLSEETDEEFAFRPPSYCTEVNIAE